MADPFQSILFTFIPYQTAILGTEPVEKSIIINKVIPEELAYSYNPMFNPQAVLNRMSPIYMYKGGSDITYTFTLTLHEDMVTDGSTILTTSASDSQVKYTKITDLIDDIKSMSYPYKDSQGLLRGQNVYFQIGAIAGRGYLETKHTWKKPFRNGRYVMVDISFTITAQLIFPSVRQATAIVENEEIETFLTYNDTVRLSESETQLVANLKKYTGLDLTISDFIFSDNITTAEKQSNINYTNKYFDRNQERFGDLLNMLDSMDPKSETVDNLQSMLEGQENLFNWNILGAPAQSKVVQVAQLATKIGALEQFKETLVEYITGDYYDTIYDEMLPEERDALVDDIEGTINAMIDLWKEVYSYAPTK